MSKQSILNHVREYGIPSRMVCPWCMGGNGHEECLSIFYADNGRTILAKCHRDKCAVDTIAVSGADPRPAEDQRIDMGGFDKDRARINRVSSYLERWAELPKFSSKPYPPLRTCAEWAMDKYVRFNNGEEEAVVRLLGPFQHEARGVVRRLLNPGPHPTGRPKAFTHTLPQSDGMGYFIRPEHATRTAARVIPDGIVVVEDVFSALAVASNTNFIAVSLNGTGLSEQRMRSLQRTSERSAKSRIILCLDADATRTALQIAQTYSGRGTLEVRRLVKDFKDMDREELLDYSNRYLY